MNAPEFGPSRPLTPPFVPAAVYHLADLDAVDAIYQKTAPGFIYARDGHPNAAELSAVLNQLSAAPWGFITASGMGALAAAFLATVRTGANILASDRLYGKTTRLLRSEFDRLGITTQFVDTSDLVAVETALKATPTALVVVETISNPHCRVADIPELAHRAHAAGAKLLVDNTFASPGLCRPLELGADLVMESGTKILNGHSDVTLGYLGGIDADLGERAASVSSTWGFAANPFDCWMTLRGLETYELRLRAATTNAARIAAWLNQQDGILRTIYPGLPQHEDFAVVQKLLPRGAGHMLTFELAGGRDAVNRLFQKTPGVPFCPSLGHTTSTFSHPDTTSHRGETAEAKARLGITPGLVRLSVGCEDGAQLQEQLARGLAAALTPR
ncbi:MAG: trans-sulfuration enzyme family protein [Gemmataceae bacterium]